MRNVFIISLVVLALAGLVGGGAFYYQRMHEPSVESKVDPAVTSQSAEGTVAEIETTQQAPAADETEASSVAGESSSAAASDAPAAEAKAAMEPDAADSGEAFTGFETLATPQPTQNPDKVEVIEFFWYGCPHCYDFEPLLASWVKKMPANVDFIRQPAAFSDLWAKHAKAFFVAQALGVVDKVHADFFDTIQNKHQKLETEDQLVAFFGAHGVKASDVRDAYNSFLVDTKVRQAVGLPARYGVTGVPVLIVNGKYKVDGRSAGSHEKMIEVLGRLIKRESAAKN